MIPRWRALLLERASAWGLPTTGEWNFLVNNNYHPHCSDLILLWFHGRDRFPRVVTKVFREAELPQREFNNLAEVHQCASEWVPKPLYCGAQGRLWTLWMEGVPGFPFRPGGSYSPAVLQSMVELVASIHARLRKPNGTGGPDRHRRTVLEPLQTLAEFGPAPSVRAACGRLASRGTANWLETLPVIPQHGDLFVGNLLTVHRSWCVVDWETYGVIDLPFYDLLTLLLSLLRSTGETPEQWDRALVEQIPKLIEAYARLLQLSLADLPLLVPLSFTNWFYLHWIDGRQKFTKAMFQMLQHYCENTRMWETVFVPATMRTT